jgi:branched-chain amino acid transport system permease protein
VELGGFLVFNGLVNGFLIALIALGLALVFGIMRIINMAHGDLYMLGAVGAVMLADSGVSFWVALVVMPLLLGGLAMPFERYVLRPLEHNALATKIDTLGLSFILQQLALITFGGQPRRLAEPVSFSVQILGTTFPGYRLVAAGIGIALLAVVWFLVYRSKLGLSLRATIERPEIADAMGINTSRVRAASFGLGTALAAVGGVLAAPINNVSHQMGAGVLLVAFIVVIVGGLGSLGGALLVALVMASIEGGATAFITPVEAQIGVLLLMSVVVLARPRGLFGKAVS